MKRIIEPPMVYRGDRVLYYVIYAIFWLTLTYIIFHWSLTFALLFELFGIHLIALLVQGIGWHLLASAVCAVGAANLLMKAELDQIAKQERDRLIEIFE